MTFSRIGDWHTVCSVCQQQGPADRRIKAAVDAAIAAGWVTVAGNVGEQLTLCPHCAARRQQSEVQP